MVDFLQNERLHFALGITILIVSVYFLIGMISYFFVGADDLSKMEIGLNQLFKRETASKTLQSSVHYSLTESLIRASGSVLLPFPFSPSFIIPIDEEKTLFSLESFLSCFFLVSLAIVKFRINRYLFGHAFIFSIGRKSWRWCYQLVDFLYR